MRPARKRKLVDTVKADWKVSIRRACAVLRIDRSLYVYKSRRGEQAELKLKIKDICQTRVRYGYRRVHVLIRRDGWAVNPKRIYRLYKEMDLQLRNKTPKRRVKAKLRADRTEPAHSNHVWAMDFVHDQLATGRKIRVLTVVDTFSRFSPAVDARFSYKGEDVVQTLERVCRQVGYPATFVWTMAANSSPETLIYGPIIRASCSTSRDQASRPTTATSRVSMASSAPSA